MKPETKLQRFEFQGEKLTAREIAERVNLPYRLIRGRLSRGKKGSALIEPKVSREEASRRSKAMLQNGGTIKRQRQ